MEFFEGELGLLDASASRRLRQRGFTALVERHVRGTFAVSSWRSSASWVCTWALLRWLLLRLCMRIQHPIPGTLASPSERLLIL